MISFPNAKINLGLHIVEKRDDGFHNLETVFYPVPWKDALEIIPSETFSFSSSGILIDGKSEHNLCVKVYKTLKEQFQLPNVKIHLQKNIPIGAGLGGGSSDAAFTAQLLKSIFNLPLNEVQLEDLVRPLGSDCAFFIKNKPVFAHEKGDFFESVSINLSGKWIVLVYPNFHISTKEAYDGVKPIKPGINIKEILAQDVITWKDVLNNDFEKSIFPKYPILRTIKDTLYNAGALYACMSGSGSTIFGIFDTPIDTQKLFEENYKIQAGYLE